MISVAVFAETSRSSPENLFIFIIKYIYLQDQSIQKTRNLFFFFLCTDHDVEQGQCLCRASISTGLTQLYINTKESQRRKSTESENGNVEGCA